MRSKFMFISMLVSSFVLVLSFQNCANVSENVSGGPSAKGPNSPGEGRVINCMAVAVPYLKFGFLFSSAVPASVEVDINNEVAYSDCGHETGDGSVIREAHKLEFYQGFEDIDGLAPSLNIRLFTKNCSTGARSEIFNDIRSNYESYELCGTTSVRMEIDDLRVN